MKCSIMLHFIWVFIVYSSSRLGVSEYKGLTTTINNTPLHFYPINLKNSVISIYLQAEWKTV